MIFQITLHDILVNNNYKHDSQYCLMLSVPVG